MSFQHGWLQGVFLMRGHPGPDLETAMQVIEIPKLEKVTVQGGQEWLNWVVSLWNRRDVPTIMQTVTPDCVIHYADQPIIHGRDKLGEFLTPRFAGFKDYHLTKIVRMAQGNMLAVDLDIRWSGAASNGEPRRTRAFEILYFEGGLVSRWELVSCPRPPDLP